MSQSIHTAMNSLHIATRRRSIRRPGLVATVAIALAGAACHSREASPGATQQAATQSPPSVAAAGAAADPAGNGAPAVAAAPAPHACGMAEHDQAARDKAAAESPAPGDHTAAKLGAPIDSSTKLVALGDIAKHPGQYAKGTVRTEGEVKAVCQAMGCWMEIGDARSEAHIRMAGHSFFIPKDAAGRHAVVQARVLARPDQGECEHEAEEATGQVVKVELEATGVELM